ncbi:MAG TPA: PP2C family protein-serine/threonine phosphatase [Streptosporangiaceae bacterium]|nr:PP2C family protein-serine/threonine phosphatase [Streptosporangiaceae bacterium]
MTRDEPGAAGYPGEQRTDPLRRQRPAVTGRKLVILVALMLVAAVPVIDPLLPLDIHTAPALSVAPAVAAVIAGPRLTALVGALAVAALVIAGAERSELSTESVVIQFGSLVALCALLTTFSYLWERRERQLVRARTASQAAHRVILRPLPDRAGPVSIASQYHAAEDDVQFGGDLYALARIPGGTRLVIGDVRGKGLASLSEAATMLEAFRAAARRQLSVPEIVAYLEASVQWGLAEFSAAEADVGERFVTAAIAEIPDDEPVVRLVVCGHPAPLLLRRGTATVLDVADPAPPLGLGSLAEAAYRPETFPFGYLDTLLMYTDGVIEARDPDGRFYPLVSRAAAWTGHAPAQLVADISADVRAFVPGWPADDLAMIAVRREEPAGCPQAA